MSPPDLLVAKLARDECKLWSRHAGYVFRGMYAAQISWWLQFFHPSQIHIINQSDMSADEPNTLKKLFRFLGFTMPPSYFRVPMSAKVRAQLLLPPPPPPPPPLFLWVLSQTFCHPLRLPEQRKFSGGYSSLEYTPDVVASMERGADKLYEFYERHNQNLYRLLEKLHVSDFSRFKYSTVSWH